MSVRRRDARRGFPRRDARSGKSMLATEGQNQTAADAGHADRTTCVLTHSGLQLGMSVLVLIAAVAWMQRTLLRSGVETGGRSPEASAKLSIGLNSSDARELSLLPGIGPKLADRVVRHRESHGPFASVEDLLAVHGVGPKLLHSLRPWVHVTRSAPVSAEQLEQSDQRRLGVTSARHGRNVDPPPIANAPTDRFDDFGGGSHDEHLARVASGRLSD
ncbi:competence protein EA [Rhodopirellula baltica WH47]|uniref:Competence protein EA n=2 Tax=Rhodopirellula baltica TaxID=265606 RepID=F2ARF3_RHOBT|nr:competence protein EA [Rhodopirellula baltica WH47]